MNDSTDTVILERIRDRLTKDIERVNKSARFAQQRGDELTRTALAATATRMKEALVFLATAVEYKK